MLTIRSSSWSVRTVILTSFELSNEIYTLHEFLKAGKHLRELHNDQYAVISLQSFIYKIPPIYYNQGNKLDVVALDDIKRRFIDGLYCAPVLGKAKVYLTGIILESETIQIDSNVVLKKTRKLDFEEQSSYEEPMKNMMPLHSAV